MKSHLELLQMPKKESKIYKTRCKRNDLIQMQHAKLTNFVVIMPGLRLVFMNAVSRS